MAGTVKTVKEETLAFVGYQMYYLGKTKEELDNMGWLEIMMEQADFNRMKVGGNMYWIEEQTSSC